jgi:uncharacterized protein YdeI (YjbR/CyaY-like superfamily)
MITDKPEELEARAAELEAFARELVTLHAGRQDEAALKLRDADRLRERAAQLRRRRTDGVRFG